MSALTEVLSGIEATRSWQEDLYRDVHAHPELSHQETRTAELAASRLEQAGYEVHRGVGGTGVVGVLENGDGPTVLLRADMDALPVREDTGLDYAQHRNGGRRRRQRGACCSRLRPRHARRVSGGGSATARRRVGALAGHGRGAVPAGGGDRRRCPRHGRRRPRRHHRQA